MRIRSLNQYIISHAPDILLNVAVDAVYSLILGIIAANGIPEAIVAVVIGGAVSLALLRVAPQSAGRRAKTLGQAK